jgi:hypothetical protein
VAGGGGVPSADECSDDFEGQFWADDTSPDAQDVHVVVLDPLPGGVRVVAQAGPNAREFVGGDADPDAGTAHQDAAIDGAIEHFPSHRFGEIRKIAGFRPVGTAVEGLDSKMFQESGDLSLHGESGVVAGEGVSERMAHGDSAK